MIVVSALLSSLVLAGSVQAAPAGDVLHWAFDEGAGGVATDSSASNLDGTVQGAQWTPGIGGTALQFAGPPNVKTFVQDPTGITAVDSFADLTVSFWVNTTQLATLSTEPRIVNRMTFQDDGYSFNVNASGAVELIQRQGGTNKTVAAGPISDGNWHHVVGTIGSSTKLYIDGIERVDSPGQIFLDPASAQFTVGGSAGGASMYQFNGLVDEVRVYPFVASAADVQDLYNDLATPPSGDSIVNSTGDLGDLVPGNGFCDTGGTNSALQTECTLRAAIEEANAFAGANTITFDIPTSDPNHVSTVWTISPSTPLPLLTEQFVLDGTSQPGHVSGPVIAIDGSSFTASAVLEFSASNSTIQGLSIHSASDEAIEIFGAADNTLISGNWLGVTPTGATPGNGGFGLLLLEAVTNTHIGGIGFARNQIVSNAAGGIEIRDAGTSGTNIDGNDIYDNTGHGIVVRDDAQATRIYNNAIYNNLLDGISIENSAGVDQAFVSNEIYGNGALGIDRGPNGPSPTDLGNTSGLLNTPQMTYAVEINNNVRAIVELDADPGRYELQVFDNPFGGDPSGFGEGQILVHTHGVDHVGGFAAYPFVFSANPGDLLSTTATLNTGGVPPDTTEFSALFTVESGVPTQRFIVNSTGDSGDVTPGDGICDTSGANSDGFAECTTRAAIEESNALPATQDIHFDIPVSDPGHTAGTWTVRFTSNPPTLTDEVVINGTTQPGFASTPVVAMSGELLASGSGFDLQASGGVFLHDLSFHSWPDAAIEVLAGANTTTLTGNWIGVTPLGAAAGNTTGIYLNNSATTSIGGNLPGQPNLIANNTLAGIDMRGAGSHNNTVRGNEIRNNGQEGILVRDAAYDNQIGSSNQIHNNGAAGVGFSGTRGPNNSVYSNTIYDNTGLGIDRDNDGVTLNDAGDLDGILNAPEITVANSNGGTVALEYSLDAVANDYVIEFFTNPGGADPSGYGEGEVLLASVPISHFGGTGVYTASVAGSVGDQVSAIATAGTLGAPAQTSEFSAVVVVASLPATVIVNSTADTVDANPGDGLCDTGNLNSELNPECTLRAAAFEANASSLVNEILFDIPTSDPGHASGVFTIAPLTPLPEFTESVIVDASSQPGYAGTPVIVLDGTATAGASPDGFRLQTTATDSTIRGFSIVGFFDTAIWTTSTGSTIAGNWIGLRPDGSAAGVGDGIVVFGQASGITIGGSAVADRNVIGNSLGLGIRVIDVGTTDVLIAGNYIGIDGGGTTAQPNLVGIGLLDSTNVTVENNVLSGNILNGVSARDAGSTNTVIRNNLIGLAANGVDPLGNDGHGIYVAAVPGIVYTADNTIAYNGQSGIAVAPDVTGTVTSETNIIYDNGGLAIDLEDDGTTPNDPGDSDGGPNELLNTIEITSISSSGANFSVELDLDVPVGNYQIVFYESPTAHPSGAGQGHTLIGARPFSSAGVADSQTFGALSFTDGYWVSGHVIDLVTNATSEFSVAVQAMDAPTNTIDPIADRSNLEGDTINLQALGTPGGTAPLTWSATGLPDGVNIDLNTGLISGTASFDSAGSRTVTVTATSADAATAVETFLWNVIDVNRDPTMLSVGDRSHFSCDVVSLPFSATDPDGDTLTWSAAGLPPGLTIIASNGNVSPGSGADACGPAISGASLPAGTIVGRILPNVQGNFPVTVAVDDGEGGTAQIMFSWTVNPSNQAPTIDPISDQTDAENDGISFTPTATDPNGDTLTWTATGLPPGLTINPATGEITGTLTFTSAGTYTTSVTATDPSSAADTASFTWTVTNTNRLPIIDPLFGRIDAENDTISLTPSATDPDGDTLTWSAINLPDGLSINTTTGAVSGTLTYDAAGVYTSQISAFDGTNSAGRAFSWTVTNTNRAPVVAPIPNRTDAENDVITLAPIGSDPDGDTLTWTATGLPANLTINPATGEISGTLGFTDAGVYIVDITTTDDGTPNLSATEAFTWTITNTNRPPTIAPVIDRSHDAGTTLSLQAVGTDPDNDPITWTATGLPTGLTINTSTGLISGTIDPAASGVFNPTITATDPSLDTDTDTFLWTVTTPNSPPVIAPQPDRSDAENDTISLTPTATDLDGDTLTWSATNLPPNLSINTTTGEITGTLTYTSAGSYATTITADDGTATDTITFTWTVTNTNRLPQFSPIPSQIDAENDTISLTPSATDPDGDTLTWSAINLPDGLSINTTTGAVSGTLTYDAAGVYTSQIAAFDGTNSAALAFSWTVTQVNRPPVVAALPDRTDAENNTISLTPSATDADGDTLTWSATGLPPGLTINPSTGEVTGTFGTGAAGSYSVFVTVDDGTDQDTEPFTWVVTDTNQTPSINPIVDRANAEGDVVNVQPVGSDPDSIDTLSWTATSLPSGLTINPATGEITGTLTFTSAGSYPVAVTTTDNGTPSLSATTTFTWDVTNVNRAPVLTASPLIALFENDSATIDIEAVDPDGDSLTWSATGLPSGLTINPATGEITGTLTFTSAGAYTTLVTVSDGPLTSTTAVQILVYNVNRAPTLSPLPTQTAEVNNVISIQPIAVDPDGDTLTFSATGLPNTLSVDPITGFISGSVISPGTYTVMLLVTDPSGLDSSRIFTMEIIDSTPPTTTTTTTTTSAPPTSTTTMPTSTTTTTSAPPTSTTTMPTTTTSVPTAPSVSPTTEAPTPEVVPTTTVPAALPFVDLRAVDDTVTVSDNRRVLDVLSNDLVGASPHIVSLTQPGAGSVEIVDGQVVIDMPPSFAGSISFQYTISDESGGQSTATVNVLSVNVLVPVSELVSESDEATSVSQLVNEVTQLFTGLVSIRLTTVQFWVLGLAPLVFVLLRVLFVRRENLVSITNTPRARSIDIGSDQNVFEVRHDALLWSTRKTHRLANGKSKTRVELPNGEQSWIDSSLITDTGF